MPQILKKRGLSAFPLNNVLFGLGTRAQQFPIFAVFIRYVQLRQGHVQLPVSPENRLFERRPIANHPVHCMSLLLSIVMPAYNEEEVIDLVVKQWTDLLTRQFPTENTCLIVVNDGSRDKTGAILDQIKAK